LAVGAINFLVRGETMAANRSLFYYVVVATLMFNVGNASLFGGSKGTYQDFIFFSFVFFFFLVVKLLTCFTTHVSISKGLMALIQIKTA
jgi:hypothetical protein